jgi:hypothetical protein
VINASRLSIFGARSIFWGAARLYYLDDADVMTRDARKIARHFPYHIRVQAGGNELLAKMYEFCRALELPFQMGTSPRSERWDYVTWCFLNPLHARAFQKEFGGALMTVTED